jgi:hypothetical protein
MRLNVLKEKQESNPGRQSDGWDRRYSRGKVIA